MTTTDIETQIRTAYEILATKAADWVRLANLRPLVEASTQDFQDTILAMTRTGHVHLAPDSNRKAHTLADRTHAIRIGTEDHMLLAIED